MGDIYDIMVKDLMARRLAEDEEDSDDDEEEEEELNAVSSQSDSEQLPELDEAERETLRRTLSMDADGAGTYVGSDYDEEEEEEDHRKRMEEPFPTRGESCRGNDEGGDEGKKSRAVGSEYEDDDEDEEEELPKAKEVTAVLSFQKKSGGGSLPPPYTIDRRWASAQTLPSLPRQQQQSSKKQEGEEEHAKESKHQAAPSQQQQQQQCHSNGSSPSSSGSHPISSGTHHSPTMTSLLSFRHLRSHKEPKPPKDKESAASGKDKDKDKKRTKEEAATVAASSSLVPPTNGGKVRKRDRLRGTFTSLREEKHEIKGKLHEWRAHRDSEKKEKEVDRELRKRAKEEAKAAAAAANPAADAGVNGGQKKASSSTRVTKKQEDEWERKDRKAAEAYAKRYGLDRNFGDRPRDATKCYTSFGDDDEDIDISNGAPLARPPQPLLGGRP